ncbi:MAG: hypothetical protein WAK26_09890 [Terracidiphilus sp.]
MDGLLGWVLTICLLGGLGGTVIGCVECVSAHNFSVAAEHEATTVGRVVKILGGKGGPAYQYVFSVNGAKVDDYSKVCETPLAPGACDNHGPVLVYYSFQPFSNSRLEDFADASKHAFRVGIPALAIGLPLFVLSLWTMVILSRRDKREGDPDVDEEEGTSKSDDVPDAIHIVPGE